MSRVNAILDEASELPVPEQRELALQLLERLEVADVPEATEPRVPGQIDGYWFGAGAEIPTLPPAYDPTGALLCDGGDGLYDGALCLDLVKLEGAWYPLSEAGRYAYAHSSSMLRDERVRFVPAGAPWATSVYEAAYADSLESVQVAASYGAEAQARCRLDYPTVRLKLRKLA